MDVEKRMTGAATLLGLFLRVRERGDGGHREESAGELLLRGERRHELRPRQREDEGERSEGVNVERVERVAGNVAEEKIGYGGREEEYDINSSILRLRRLRALESAGPRCEQTESQYH